MTTKTLDLNNIERKIFWVLTSLLVLVLSFYLYSVMALALAVGDRNNTNAEAHELATSVGVLEAEYLAQANIVTLAYAKELGFQEVSAKYAGATASVNTAGVVLSMAR